MILVIFLSFGYILTSSLYPGFYNALLCHDASSTSAQAFSLSSASNSSEESWHGRGKHKQCPMAHKKVLFNSYDSLWKEVRHHPLLRTYCQTLEKVQTGNGQHSSCPSAQKSRRVDSGLAWMTVYLKTGKRLSPPVYFFCDWADGEFPAVFQSVQKGTQMSELRDLTDCLWVRYHILC